MKVSAALCCLLAVQFVTLHVARAQDEIVADEIAPYEVLKVGEGYEERYYPSARWVCHGKSLVRPTMNKMQRSFFPLFYYIAGNNDKEYKIEMTAPVTMVMRQDLNTGKWRTQMCFYIPEAHQENPPAPTDPEVYIEDRPAMIVYARREGGFMTRSSQWNYLAEQLKQALEDNKEQADYSSYYMAGYDSPMQFENRRNEVWIMKKSSM